MSTHPTNVTGQNGLSQLPANQAAATGFTAQSIQPQILANQQALPQGQSGNLDTNTAMNLIFQELASIRNDVKTLTTVNTDQTNAINSLKLQFEGHIKDHNALKECVNENSSALSSQHSDILDLQKKVDNYETRLAILEGATRRQDLLTKELRTDLTKQISKSMKINTVFYNVTEGENETVEQTKAKVVSFLTDEMKMPAEEVETLSFLRVHRLGSKTKKDLNKETSPETSSTPTPRPIIVKFLDNDKQRVFSYIKNLDRSKFAVCDQYPTEYQESRLLLKDRMKNDPNISSVSAEEKRLIDNQLMVKGKPYVLPEHRQETAPEHYNASDVDWERDPPHITVGPSQSDRKSVFQGFRARIGDLQEAQVVLDLIHADFRAQPATHVAYAYRIKSGSHIIEHMDDDREFGVGRQLLDVLRDKKYVNTMVAVARWYGGINLGPKRKARYTESAKQVLDLR